MTITKLRRDQVRDHLKGLKTFTEDFFYEFDKAPFLKDTEINLLRIRYGPTGIDGVKTNNIEFALEKFKHWNCDWIELLPDLVSIPEEKRIEE